MNQKIKNDCEAAELKTQVNYTPREPKKSMPARIYRAKDNCGILAAVETPKGDCFVGYFSTVRRAIRKADLRSLRKDTHSKCNPVCLDWAEVQSRLDAYAINHNLSELPLTIGGEI